MLKIIKLFLFISSIFLIWGCTLATPLMQNPEEKLYHQGRYEEVISYLENHPSSIVNNNQRKQQVVSEKINRIREKANQQKETPEISDIIPEVYKLVRYEFGFVRYIFQLRYLAHSLIEIGNFSKALAFCDIGINDCKVVMEEMLRSNRQDASFEFLMESIRLFTAYKGYITWFKTGKIEDAEHYFDISLELSLKTQPDKRKIFALMEMGFFYGKIIADHKKALESYERAYQLATSLSLLDLDSKYAYSLQALRKMMHIHIRVGNLNGAQTILKRYEEMSDNILLDMGKFALGNSDYFRGYLSMMDSTAGALFSILRDFEKAKFYFDKANKIVKKINPDSNLMWDRNALASYHVFYGAYYLGLQKNYKKAVEHVDHGISYLKPYFIESIQNEIDIETAYILSSELHFIIGNYEKALHQADISIKYANRYHDKLKASRGYTMVGEVFQKKGDMPKASEAYKKALQLTENMESTENWRLYYGIGKIYQIKGDHSQALNFFKKAVNEVEKVWQGRLADTRKQVSFIDERLIVFEPLISMNIDSGNFSQAVNYMERSKARTFFDNVVFKQERGSTFNLNSSSIKSLSGKEIQSKLKRKNVVLEYYIGPNLLLGAFISKKDITCKILKKFQSKEDLEFFIDKVVLFRRTTIDASEQNDDEFFRTGRELYDILIKPFELKIKEKNSICIVPHGIIHRVPFSALPLLDFKESKKYFVHSFSLSYAPSITILNTLTERAIKRNRERERSLLAVGDLPEIELDEKYPRLANSKKEVKEVGIFFDKNLLVYGKNATETMIKKNIPLFNTILFSTHAKIMPTNPLSSFILLCKDRMNDGKLTVEEIEALKINSEIVVLNACETGIVIGYEKLDGEQAKKKLPFGDDLVALERAFLKAGASSVISTAWSVLDDSSAEFIVKFFEFYLENNDKSLALRQAQLYLLENGKHQDWSHPSVWAAYKITGNLN